MVDPMEGPAERTTDELNTDPPSVTFENAGRISSMSATASFAPKSSYRQAIVDRFLQEEEVIKAGDCRGAVVDTVARSIPLS